MMNTYIDISNKFDDPLLIEVVNELDKSGNLPLVVQSAGSSPEINKTYGFWSAIYNELKKS